MPVIRELSEAVEVGRVQRQRRSWVWVDAGALANQSGLSTGWVMSSASEWRWVCLGFLSYISEVFFFFPFSFLWWLSVQRGVCNKFFFFFEWFISMFPIVIEFFLVALFLRQIFVFFSRRVMYPLNYHLLGFCSGWLLNLFPHTYSFFILHFDSIGCLGILGRREKEKK